MTKDPWREMLDDKVGGIPRVSHEQWARRIGAHLAEVDVARLRSIDSDACHGAERFKQRWKLVPCVKPLREPDADDPFSGCWCAMVAVESAADVYKKEEDDLYVIGAATVHKADARLLVEMHNLVPAICDLRELLDQPTWCGRCGRNDLRLWEYHSHIFSCMSTTDEEYEINTLKADLEAARAEIITLREDLNAEIKDRGGRERTWGYDG